jgi:hypothetical protein
MTVLENLEMGAFQRKDRSSLKGDLERVYSLFPRLAERKSQRRDALGRRAADVRDRRALMARPKLLMLDEPSMGSRRSSSSGSSRSSARSTSRDHDPARRAERADGARRVRSGLTVQVSQTGGSRSPTTPKSLRANEDVRKTYLGERNSTPPSTNSRRLCQLGRGAQGDFRRRKELNMQRRRPKPRLVLWQVWPILTPYCAEYVLAAGDGGSKKKSASDERTSATTIGKRKPRLSGTIDDHE